ncbi:MAG: hypothetical protein KDA31_08150 [Phycisphaerales bacterium]|nr:hypothetical protein [Phycisphaerales bacterium]MCB9835881.1 hypothetical protein [Phycisphaera sp.]
MYAINNKGESVGSRESPSGTRAVMWDPTGVGTNLGLAMDVDSATAIDINDEGTVLYRGHTGVGAGWYARSNKAEYTKLEPPSGYDMVSAGALNSYGEVVGAVDDDGSQIGVVWRPTPGGMATELFPSTVNSFVNGTAINDSGIAAFAIFTGSGRTTIVDRRTGSEDMSNIGAQVAWVEDLNNSGSALVVTDGDGLVLETYATGLGSVFPFGCDGYCQQYGDGDVDGYALNEMGEIVGRSVTVEFDGDGEPTGDNGIYEAFVWSSDTGTMKLVDLIVEGDTAGWFLERAVDINDAGWIVGNGTKNGEPRSFLLIPREPCVGDANRDGQVTPADFSAWVSAFNSGCD